MPNLGDIKKAGEIGRGYAAGLGKYIWAKCVDCGTERWTQVVGNKAAHLLCHPCAAKKNLKNLVGEKSSRWKGGRRQDKHGYVEIKVYKDNFFSPMMTCNGYIREHRLVMAQHLGRCLQRWEYVHHKNGDKADNRLRNLELTMDGAHVTQHNKGYKDGFRRGYEDGKREALLANLKSEIQNAP